MLRSRRTRRVTARGPLPQQADAPAPNVHLAASDLLAWLAARPLLDRALTRVLRSPHLLGAASITLGLALFLSSLAPLVAARPASAAQDKAAYTPRGLPTATAATNVPADDEALAVVAAYNHASIAAGQLGRADFLAPYLTADGQAWREVQAEYMRRSQRGETSEAALVRWGVLQKTVAGERATIETQEQWDVVTSIGGQVISSRRGVLVRNRYELEHTHDAGWQIVSVATTTLIA